MKARSGSNLGTAFLGLAITAAFVSYQLVSDPGSPISRNSALMLAFVILCPPSVLSIVLSDPEAGSNAFLLLWSVIGLLNAALYVGVRAIVLKRLQRPD